MSRYSSQHSAIPMSELSHPQPGHSRSLDNEEFGDGYLRPSTAISGHKKFNTIYTGPRGIFESHADKIVATMEKHRELMEDTPISEQLRKETLRELPQCMTMKRCVKMKLSKSVGRKSKHKPISFWTRLKYHVQIKFAQVKYNSKNFNYFEVWNATLRDIEGHFGSGYASYFKFHRWLFVMDFLIALLSFSLIVVPQIIYDSSGTSGTIINTREFRFQDIFTGAGYFYETVLYYGHYTNNTIALVPYLSFYMPAAYFSVTVILYLLSFLILGASVAQSYRRSFIETEGGFQNVYANKVFCGWDYAVATKEAAELKSSTLYNELKELLSESMENKEDVSCLKKFWTHTIQVIVNVLILILLFGVGLGCSALLGEFSVDENNPAIVTTVVINVAMVVLPLIFNLISKYEDYNNPRTTLYITLTRTYLLGCVVIGTIVAFWLTKTDTIECWENHLGAEIYRLVLFDFIFSIVLLTLIEITFSAIKRCWGKDSKSEFNISQHTLEVIYNQALFWVGFFYSPVLPLMVTLKMFIIWYIREGYVRNFCRPPIRTWRAAQTQTWFLMLTFVSLLLIIAIHGFTLKSFSPSNCGAFKNYDFIYQILTENIAEVEHDSAVFNVIMYITKPGAVTLIMIGVCVLVYCFKEQASAQKEKVKMLRDMLVWTSKDKKFLTQMYTQVSRGKMINIQNNRFIDPSLILPQEAEYDYPTRENFNVDYSASTDDNINARFKKYS